MKLIIDTREQEPLPFEADDTFDEIIVRGLKVGDYSIAGFEDSIAIDRKNPLDFFGTLTGDHERFRRECERAKCMDYFGILVEAPFSTIRDKKFPQSFRTRMRGDVTIGIAMSLKLKHGVDVVFVRDRAEAMSYIRHLFKAYYRWRAKEAPIYRVSTTDDKVPLDLLVENFDVENDD